MRRGNDSNVEVGAHRKSAKAFDRRIRNLDVNIPKASIIDVCQDKQSLANRDRSIVKFLMDGCPNVHGEISEALL